MFGTFCGGVDWCLIVFFLVSEWSHKHDIKVFSGFMFLLVMINFRETKCFV